MDHFNSIRMIRTHVELLAAGSPEVLSEAQYTQLAEECADLSSYLDSISEGYRVASSPECTALLAAACDVMSKPRSGGGFAE